MPIPIPSWLSLGLLVVVLIPAIGCGPRPRGPSSTVLKADALRKTSPTQARDQLVKYVAENPKDELGLVVLANCYLDLRQEAQAEEALKKALAINPKSQDAIVSLGVLCRKQEKYPEAMSYYQQSLALNPKDAATLTNMAVVAIQLKQYAKAVEYAEQAYALNSSEPVIAANLALAYHAHGMTAKRDELTTVAKRLGYSAAKLDRVIYGEEPD